MVVLGNQKSSHVNYVDQDSFGSPLLSNSRTTDNGYARYDNSCRVNSLSPSTNVNNINTKQLPTNTSNSEHNGVKKSPPPEFITSPNVRLESTEQDESTIPDLDASTNHTTRHHLDSPRYDDRNVDNQSQLTEPHTYMAFTDHFCDIANSLPYVKLPRKYENKTYRSEYDRIFTQVTDSSFPLPRCCCCFSNNILSIGSPDKTNDRTYHEKISMPIQHWEPSANLCLNNEHSDSEYVTLDYTYRTNDCGNRLLCSDVHTNRLRSHVSDLENKFFSSPKENYSCQNNDSDSINDVYGFHRKNKHLPVLSFSDTTEPSYLQRSISLPDEHEKNYELRSTSAQKSMLRSFSFDNKMENNHSRNRSTCQLSARIKNDKSLPTVDENKALLDQPGRSILKKNYDAKIRSESTVSLSSITNNHLDRKTTSYTKSSDTDSNSNIDLEKIIPPRIGSTKIAYNKMHHRTNAFDEIDNVEHCVSFEKLNDIQLNSNLPVNCKHLAEPINTLIRSKSLSDLRLDNFTLDAECQSTPTTPGCYSDDEDGDDFGFLREGFQGKLSRSNCTNEAEHDLCARSTVMNKGNDGGSASVSHRLIPRRWRVKNKRGFPRPRQVMWSPEVRYSFFVCTSCSS